MHTSVTFKNLDSSDNLRAYVSEKLDRFDKFLDNPAEANVVLTVQKFRHIAEINIAGDRLSINGKEETNDMYSAIDMVLDKIEKQIKKSKQKIREKRAGARERFPGYMEDVKAESDEKPNREIIIQSIEYKPMDVEEAIMQMDLTSDNFIVFSNPKTDQLNVLYRRKDGNYGLIQPSA
jgi:putative sigma-54 modulation protein